MSTSAFGIEHGYEVSKSQTGVFSKAEPTDAERRHKRQVTGAAVGTGGAVAGTGVLLGTKMPEHSHYNKKTRKYLHSLPAGEHDVPTKMLAHRPRKLGARKQQTAYVATMARERPLASFHSSPVPVTRYKGGHVIQRDSAHTVMANAMKGRTTRIKIEDAPGHRPTRRTGEELVRRGQMKYQQKRLKQNFNLSEKKIAEKAKVYTKASRKANTAKRPHGVVEEKFKFHPNKFGPKQLLGAGKNIARAV